MEAALTRVEQMVAQTVAMRDAVIADSPDSIFVAGMVDQELRWLYANESFGRLSGCEADEMIGRKVETTGELDRLVAGLLEVAETGAPIRFDEKRELNGCKVELQTKLTPMRSADGGCLRIAGVSRDVTEHKAAERMLRKQNRRLQNILDSISDGFVTVDREWRITFLNARAEKILEAPRGQLLGVAFWGAFPQLAQEELRGSIESMTARQAQAVGQTIVHDGSRWLAMRTFPSQEGVAIYFQDITDQKAAQHALKQGLERTQASLDGIVSAMAFAVEMRDPYTGGHQRRVSALACAIARVMGMTVAQIETLRIAGLLHDIGKISIPTEILNRPGKLSDAETIIVRTHAQISYEILKEIEFASPVALIALQHHERLDGSGYPQGLASEAIILEARILAVADVVEAMASHRPYRPALGVECALGEVMKHRGTRYDELAVDACLSVFTESGFDFEQLMQAELGRRQREPIT